MNIDIDYKTALAELFVKLFRLIQADDDIETTLTALMMNTYFARQTPTGAQHVLDVIEKTMGSRYQTTLKFLAKPLRDALDNENGSIREAFEEERLETQLAMECDEYDCGQDY